MFGIVGNVDGGGGGGAVVVVVVVVVDDDDVVVDSVMLSTINIFIYLFLLNVPLCMFSILIISCVVVEM